MGHYVWRFDDSCKDVRDDWYTGSIRWSVAHDYINAQVFLARDACYLHNYTSPTGKQGQYRDTLECQQSHEQQDEGGSLPWCGVPGAAFSGSEYSTPARPSVLPKRRRTVYVTRNSGMLNTGAHWVSSGRDRRLSVRQNRDFSLNAAAACRPPTPACLNAAKALKCTIWTNAPDP